MTFPDSPEGVALLLFCFIASKRARDGARLIALYGECLSVVRSRADHLLDSEDEFATRH